MNRIKGYLLAPVAGAAVLASAIGIAGTAAHADTFTQNGAYQFAASSGTVAASNEFSDSPLAYSDASQTLGANGVSLSAGPNADVGVVVPLGRLHDLFNADGQFVPPAIVGSNLEGYNLYVDTSASGTYLGFPKTSASVFLDQGGSDTPAYDGTNKLAMGAVNNDNAAAVGVDCVWAGQNATVLPAGTCAITMAQVKADYAANPNGDDNPLVWAWIGVGDSATAQAGFVTSVDGVSLVTDTPTVTVPNEVGRTDLSYAESLVAAAGLTPAGAGGSPARNLGSVTSQVPAAGTAVSPGSGVTLTYTVTQAITPNVVGRSQASAFAADTAAGLGSVGTRTIPGKVLIVRSASPSAGTRVPLHSTVTVTSTIG